MFQKIFLRIISFLPQIVALLFIGAFAVFIFFNQKEGLALAGLSDNVSGYAWSDNIGWISFNNTTGGGRSYGVDIDISAGNNRGKFSGYAWSDNIGWISFNEADTDAPPSNDPCSDDSCIAKAASPSQLGRSSVNILGWARALSYGGGWDGWIRFDHGQTNPVYIDSLGNFHGWAWGSDVVGWINFYNVVLNLSGFNQPPDKPTFPSPAETWNNCSLQGVSKITFHWNYSDPDSDPQDSYQVLVDDNPGFSSPEIDSCLSNTCLSGNSSQSYTPITALNWNNVYYWKVKVKDNQGDWSNWSNSESFTTPSHAYPWIDFSWAPFSPNANELIQFNNQTIYYGGASGQSWAWDFGDSQTASLKNPTHSYSALGTYQVKLGVCDNSGLCCAGADSRQKSIQISLPLPEWKEISPF